MNVESTLKTIRDFRPTFKNSKKKLTAANLSIIVTLN